MWTLPLALALLAGSAQAQTAQAPVAGKIEGPTTAKCGELVELQITIIGDSSIFSLEPMPDQLLERYTEAGTTCYLFLASGKVTCYKAELLVFGVVDGKAKAVKANHRLCVDSPNPEPEPGPKPPEPKPPSPPEPDPPKPNPVPDDGRFGVAQIAYHAAIKVDRPAEAAKLAAVYRETAAKIKSEQAGPLRVLSLIKEACAKIGVHKSGPWAPFNEAVSNRLRTLYGDGLLAQPDDWAACFEEIAKGLEAVR